MFPPLAWQNFLGHSSIRLFITHGGLLGMQEALYHSVPLLALPFGTDQYLNSAKMRKEGCGLRLDWDTLEETTLFTSITTIIDNSRLFFIFC
jgi:glucuronosyltransferase